MAMMELEVYDVVDENYIHDKRIYAEKLEETLRQMRRDAAKKWKLIRPLSIGKVDGAWTRIRDETRASVLLDGEANAVTATLKELKKKVDNINDAMRSLEAARLRTEEMKLKFEKRNSELKDTEEPQRITYLKDKLEKYENRIAEDAEAMEALNTLGNRLSALNAVDAILKKADNLADRAARSLMRVFIKRVDSLRRMMARARKKYVKITYDTDLTTVVKFLNHKSCFSGLELNLSVGLSPRGISLDGLCKELCKIVKIKVDIKDEGVEIVSNQIYKLSIGDDGHSQFRQLTNDEKAEIGFLQ